MIVLDTHIWVWWVQDPNQLSVAYQECIALHESQGLGISIISCWEVAKPVEYGRVTLSQPVAVWIDQALAYPGVRLLPLTPQIVVESTQLPGSFHRDPADQLIVATARIYQCPLVTVDSKIRAYPYIVNKP